jgi:imidazolonepropionase-like amidohydrolase
MSKLQKRLCAVGLALTMIAGFSMLTLMSQQRGGGGRQPAGQGQGGGDGVYTDLPGVFRQEPIGIARALGLYNLKHPPREGVAIKAGRMFDAPTGRMLTNQVILVNGDMIRQVGPANVVQIPTGAQVVDLSNATVIPGLIDAHVHIMDSILERMPNEASLVLRAIPLAMQHVQGGYTTLVDMGSGDSWAPIEYRDAVNRGWVPGPRIEVAGPHLNPRVNTRYPAPSVFIDNFGQGPYSPSGRPHWENGSNFYSAADGRRLVREHAWYGVDLIKAYMTEDIEDGGDVAGFGGAFYPNGKMINIQSLTYDEIAAAADEAHRHNLRVAVHVYGGPGLCDTLRAGVDLPMHAAVGCKGEVGLSDEVVELWKKPLWDGTARMAMHTLWDLEDQNAATSYAGIGQGGGNMHSGDMRRTDGQHSRMELTEKAFRKLHAAGIKQVFGSGDYGPLGRVPGQQSMQFPIFVKWGMTPAEALQTATVNAAAFLNPYLKDRVGVIKAGTFADIIAVPGNPLNDPAEMLNVKWVMKGGVIYRDEIATAKATSNNN